MENLVEVSVNTMLNKIIDAAICKAIKLQSLSDIERKRQKEKECVGEPYDYTAAHAYGEGVSAMGHVLQEMFGGLPADCIQAVRKIVRDNRGDVALGFDSRDYVRMFRDALEAVSKRQ